MSGSQAVEIDFFRIKDESPDHPTLPPPKKLFDRRDIQGVISKINPELLKTAIASANKTSNKSCGSVPSSPILPVYNHTNTAPPSSHHTNTTTPLTIFYNGTVSVFDVSPHQAESIIKLVDGGSSNAVESVDIKPVVPPTRLGAINQDLPLSRKKSLRRFLEKRKERQSLASPYASPIDNASFRWKKAC